MINVSLHGVDVAGELERAFCLDAFARQGFVLLERDCVRNRLLGLTINLAEAPIVGGQLQMRHCKSGAAPKFNFAVFFRRNPIFET